MMFFFFPTYFDINEFVLESLEFARCNALKSHQKIGEPFEHALRLLMAALIVEGISVKHCGNERERVEYELAAQRILQQCLCLLPASVLAARVVCTETLHRQPTQKHAANTRASVSEEGNKK